jgi:hypothetical protein
MTEREDEMIKPCEICSAKDKEIEFMTAHIDRLTKMVAQNRSYIQALMSEIKLKEKANGST